ncbi:MAG: chorismate synthase [Helicobacteraceae bacterium]|jgi:chorismate synthase|nr:chorismate synthase [Helicobacteraceae bacterium]
MNSFGTKLRLTTFGESHGSGVGCVLDGVPSGLTIDGKFIQSELDRRKPGDTVSGTKRKEADRAEILSGVFEGVSTGAPIAVFIANIGARSQDYDELREIFRPAHADYSWFMKYGVRDHRGGGRSSARESAARVAAGAIAKLMLKEIGVTVKSGVALMGGTGSEACDFEYAKNSPIFSLDPNVEAEQIAVIKAARRDHDSIGAIVKIRAEGVPPGLGEPLYGRLDAKLAEAMMGINAVKAVEIGAGVRASFMRGSENNDQMSADGFLSANAGGILGGVSSGEPIDLTVYFKPTPSIGRVQRTIDIRGNERVIEIKGRHDVCVGVRGAVVCEAMTALVIADMLLLNLSSRLECVIAAYTCRKPL